MRFDQRGETFGVVYMQCLQEGKKLGVIPPSRNHHSNRYQSFLSQLVMVLDGTIDSVRSVTTSISLVLFISFAPQI